MKSNRSKLQRKIAFVGQSGYRGWLGFQIWLWNVFLITATGVESALTPMRQSATAGDLSRLRQDLLEESQLN
ncbi:MAG: DUF389 domain-containing protein, partial [Nodosilinea sp.]